MTTAKECFAAGDLTAARQAATQVVRKDPGNVAARWFLCELLCYDSEWQRVESHLETIAKQDVSTSIQMSVGLFRHLIRAAVARQEVFREGRVPTFLEEPSPVLKRHLEATVLLRSGDGQAAVDVLEAAAEEESRLAGTCNGEAFTGFRDLDDLTSAFFEVLTAGGEYCWIQFDQIESVQFRAAEKARDLLWRPCHVELQGGRSFEAFIPAVYNETDTASDEALKLGRATDWQMTAGQPVRGLGQRTFLVDDRDTPILEITELSFHHHAQS